MSQYEFDEILQKYLAGECTPAEENIVLRWYEKFIGESEIQLSPDEKQRLEQKIWSNIQTGIIARERQPSKVRRLSQRWVRITAAASIIFLLTAGAYLYFGRTGEPAIQSFNNIKIPGGYRVINNENNVPRVVRLSDGSMIELQPQSALYYPENFTGATRNVYLTGNAFFQVAHDSSKHFIVYTDEKLVTEVLGTSFFIRHDKVTHKVEVSVITGKVSVYEEKGINTGKTTGNGRIILTPNQKVSYKPLNNQFVTSLVEDPKPVRQASGNTAKVSFVFEETPLSRVLKSLEEVYGITIKMENENLSNCHFTGDITRQSLYDKLDILCRSTQSSYEVRGTLIYMRGEGCD